MPKAKHENWVKPEDIARTLAFLSSEENKSPQARSSRYTAGPKKKRGELFKNPNRSFFLKPQRGFNFPLVGGVEFRKAAAAMQPRKLKMIIAGSQLRFRREGWAVFSG